MGQLQGSTPNHKFTPMKTKLTKYLLENGWERTGDMSFVYIQNGKIKIYFDTSNQLELHVNEVMVADVYIVSPEELRTFLDQWLK